MGRYTVDGMEPKEVVTPEDVDEVVSVLKRANEEGLGVLVVGGGSKLSMGMKPKKYDIALSTSRLGGVLEFSPEDFTVSVGGGMKLKELQEILGKENQFLPIDAPYYNDATIGGIVAANTNGPRRFHYGAIRDLILGAKFVSGSGIPYDFGGKVVKNVAGYRVRSFLTGSMGTLAVITELTLKTYPLQEKEASVIALYESADEALKSAMELPKKDFSYTAIDVLGKKVSNLMEERHGIGANDLYALVVRLEGFGDLVEEHSKAVEEGLKGSAKTITLNGKEHFSLWGFIQDVQGNLPKGGEKVLLRIGVPRSSSPAIFKKAEGVLSEFDPFVWLHEETGIMYAAVMGGDPRELKKGIVKLRKESEKLDGYLVVESAPVELKEMVDVWGDVGEALELMRGLKEVFDPNYVLSPGRFVGGI
ncbi:MAG: FAD-binding oxidoreductase [Thaumarchaeota archaeon]|nr:FAD-binding oxidoreductase [Nitrososphaerota archaeon]